MLDEVFKNYENIYRNILTKFYPSLGSTGFQERNLTVNFSKAFEKLYGEDEIISWFELQFGEKKDNHFDCIIIKEGEIYIVEAKRYTTPKKEDSVKKDIDRIIKFVKETIDSDTRFSKFNDYNVYGVILADVWTESKPKENIRQKYIDKVFFEKEQLDEQEYNVINFKNLGEKSDYALLSFSWRVR